MRLPRRTVCALALVAVVLVGLASQTRLFSPRPPQETELEARFGSLQARRRRPEVQTKLQAELAEAERELMRMQAAELERCRAEQLRQPPSRGFELAAAESEGFFQDIADSDWRLMKQRPSLRGKGETRLPAARWYQHNWEPSFTCQHERRVGGNGDGSKWVCDPHRIDKSSCLVYSVGSDNDFKFEQAVLTHISTDCEIHTFDPTETNPSNKPEQVRFHPWGIGRGAFGRQPGAKKTAPDASMKTMAEIVKELGHSGRRIDLFKIDCEGCEFDTFDSWFGEGVHLHQVLMEIHAGTQRATPTSFAQHSQQWAQVQRAGPPAHVLMSSLAARNYEIFHKEPNIGSRRSASQSDCVEYALIKMSADFRGKSPQ